MMNIRESVLPPPRLAGICVWEALRREATAMVMTSDQGGGTVRIESDEREVSFRLPLPIWRAMLQTLKAVAGLDPDDDKRSQNGRARYEIDGRPCDLIVVTTPSERGESAVITIAHAARVAGLDLLGINPASIERLRAFITNGDLVLLAGGRHMTSRMLAAVSDEMLRRGKEVVELERGGERQPTGRSLPNHSVAMVGWMNDAAQAATAIAASVRGHLVVIGTPALDAIGAMQLLVESGLDPMVVMQLEPVIVTVHGLRRLCRACAEPIGRMTRSEERLAAQHGMTPLFRASGCSQCGGTGYSGMIPHAQISISGDPLQIDDESWAAELVARGQTSIEEVARILGDSANSQYRRSNNLACA